MRKHLLLNRIRS